MESGNEREWLSVAELAAMLKKSRSTVHKQWPAWASRYGLKPARFGGERKRGRLLFLRSDVEAMLEQWRIA